MGDIRRGSAAIQEAAESAKRGDGTFRPFIPSIYWKEDKEERYVLFLNEIDVIPTFDMITFIKTEEGFYQEAVAKTDQVFGERGDRFVDEWDATARKTTLAIAVELEPVIEVVNKRRRPKGFEVKTVEYDRTILDDEGNATDQTEPVTAPAVGVISQSPNNFFNVIGNFDANELPIHETPLKITRIGKDTNTAYTVVGYEDQPIDLSNLFEYLDGISYLNDEIDGVINRIAGETEDGEDGEPLDDKDAALYVGNLLLDKKINELIDDERYDELFEGVHESMDIYGKKKKGRKGASKKERPARTSQRRTRQTEAEVDPEPGHDENETEDEKPKSKAKAKTARKTSQATPKERMAALRDRAAKQGK